MDKQRQIYSSTVLILATGGGFFYCLIKMKETTLSIHPMLLPTLVLGCMTLLSLCRLVTGLRMQQGEEMGKKKIVIPMKTVLTMVLLLAYAILFNPLGFVVSSAIYIFAQMCLLKTGEKNYVLMLGLSVIGPLLIYLLFVYALNVMLPAGILWF